MNKKLLNHVSHRTAPMPKNPWVMHQTWEDLLSLHIQVRPDELSTHIPDQLELDLYDGKAWISIFPFHLQNLRLRGLPKFPYFHKFLELNVRTYVTYKRIPGVYFFSLDAAKIIPVIGARLLTLPYYKADMTMTNQNGWTHYSSKRRDKSKAYFNGKYKVLSRSSATITGSLEHWLFERYRLYRAVGSKVFHINVHHTPWELAEVSVFLDNESVNSLLPGNVTGEPLIAHYTPSLEVFFWPWQKS